MNVENEIVCSVIVTAYNQEALLPKALDSILMQEVPFRYEIVIAEDCSTDGTKEIVNQYQHKYPDIIFPIFNEHNMGLIRNFKNALRKSRGTYVAILECDDYWIDPNKLRKQIAFLDIHPDYSAVYTNAWVVDENDNRWSDTAQKNYTAGYVDEDKDADISDFSYKLRFGHTCTAVFRNYFAEMTENEWGGD